MSWEIVLRRTAQTEFDREAVWYEDRCPDLGVRFVEEVERVLRNIASDPHRFAVVCRGTR